MKLKFDYRMEGYSINIDIDQMIKDGKKHFGCFDGVNEKEIEKLKEYLKDKTLDFSGTRPYIIDSVWDIASRYYNEWEHDDHFYHMVIEELERQYMLMESGDDNDKN